MKKAVKIFLKIILWLFVSVVVLLLLIQTPPVQNFARKKAQAWLQKKLGTRVEIGHIYIGLPSAVEIGDIYVEDQSGDTLLSGGNIRANINLFKLMRNELKIGELKLRNLTAKIKRNLPAGNQGADTVYNFQFIIDAFAGEEQKEPKKDGAAMKMALNKLYLDDIRFIYDDTVSGNDWVIQLTHFNTRIEKFDPDNLIFDIPSVNLNGLVARMRQYKPLVTDEAITQNDTSAGKLPVLTFNELSIKNIDVDYRNTVSSVYLQTTLENLEAETKQFDLTSRQIGLQSLQVDGLKGRFELGRTEEAKKVSEKAEQETKDIASQGWRMSADDIQVSESFLRFDDNNKPRQPGAMDYAHLDALNISLRASNFLMGGDSIRVRVQDASLKEQSGFNLQKLEGEFLYTAKVARADNFLVKTPGTRIQHTIRLSYPSIESLKEHIEQLQLQATLPDSYVTINDILIFAPSLKNQPLFSNPREVIKLDARIHGSIDNLVAEKLQVSGFKHTSININGTVKGLPAVDNLGGNINLRSVKTSGRDIAGFLPQSIQSQFEFPEAIEISGTLSGTARQAKINLNVRTTSGNLFIDGNIANLNDKQHATYTAQVRTDALQAGRLLKNNSLQNITAEFQLQGSGLGIKTADATLKGVVQSVGFKEYIYKGIKIEGSFKNQQAQGTVAIKDPNLDFTADIKTDLSDDDPALHAIVTIDSIKTEPLNLTSNLLIYRGQVKADFENINPDRLNGEVNIVNSLLVMQGEKRLQLDSVKILAVHKNDYSRISLRSDIANASIEGKYRLTDIGTVFQQAVQPYFAIMPGSEMERNIPPYNFTVTATVDENPAIKILMPSLVRLGHTRLTGHFASDSGWKATIDLPVLEMNTLKIQNMQLQAGTDTNRLKATTSIQQINLGGNTFYNLDMQAVAANNQLDFSTNFNDKQGKEKYAFAGVLQQPYFGSYLFSLKDNLLLNYEKWTVAPDNSIRIGNDSIYVTNFILNHDFQQFSLKSRGNDANAPVEAYFTSFGLSSLLEMATPDSMNINGTLDGEILFRDILKQPVFSGDLKITNLSFKNDTLGNVTVKANNTNAGNIKADVTLVGYGNDVSIAGNYYTKPVSGNDFNFDVNIKQLNPATIEGATAGAVKNASGIVSGKFSVAGTAGRPVVNGRLRLQRTAFNLSMLNNYFRVEDETIVINREGIRFDNFRILDSAKNAANLDGMLYTSDFRSYRFDLSLRANNFRALNTTRKDNQLYYGTLYFSSNMQVRGTKQLPVIDGTITIEDKTNLTVEIPQREPGVVQREGVVQFVDMDAPENDSLFINAMAGFDSLNTSGIKGLDISANIEIKKEAVFGLLIDQANGDFLRMQGEGLLNGTIDQSGKVTLAGSYEMQNGTYELTFNFLRRKFNIQKGSRIVWSGEPTKADVNITAVYVANTPPLDLVKNQLPENLSATERNKYLQRLPFEVQLNMKGELLQPEVTFDIRLPEDRNYGVSGEIVSTSRTKLEQLRQEPSELNKQVFALLLLNRFITENPFESSGGGLTAESFARQSASKLLTEQLNRLASGLIEGVDINFNIESQDDYSTGTRQSRTDLNVGLSKRLLNDRLKVTVGSNFELEGPQSSKQDVSSIVGNIAVDYSLSKDGRYMLRAYRKNEYEGVIDGYVIETGVGFIITLDYNRFWNIFLSKKGREERRNRRQEARRDMKEEKEQALENEENN